MGGGYEEIDGGEGGRGRGEGIVKKARRFLFDGKSLWFFDCRDVENFGVNIFSWKSMIILYRFIFGGGKIKKLKKCVYTFGREIPPRSLPIPCIYILISSEKRVLSRFF